MKQQDQTQAPAGEVQRNAAQSRYEIHVDGTLAGFAAYREEAGRVYLTHTEVQPAYAGQGLGSRLAAQALEDIRSRGLKVVPQCTFVAAFIRRHPEYRDLVA